MKKITFSTLVVIFLSVTIFGSFSHPKPAHAGWPTSVIGDLPALGKWLKDELYNIVTAAVINAGVRAASYAMRKVTYDTAIWLSTGGKGQGPMMFTSDFGSYLSNVANEAGGEAVAALGQPYGLNLCKVPDIKIDLAMRIGLRTSFSAPQKPACNFTTFVSNWKDGLSKFSKKSLIDSFNASLSVSSDSDFGIYLDSVEKVNNYVLSQNLSAVYQRQEGGGYRAQTKAISGQVQTPAGTVKKSAESTLTPDEIIKKNEAEFNAAIASGDVKVFPSLLGLFLNTLGGNILTNFTTKGMLPFGVCVGGIGGGCGEALGNSAASLGGDLSYNGTGISTLGRVAAQNYFNYLLTVKIDETSNFDLIGQLSSCPGEGAGIYNCRLGDDLLNAINQQLTIGDAIKKGVLDGNRMLISPSSMAYAAKNADPNCYRDAYCLSNVKILRQVRILPLGFEIAVQKSEVSNPWKLSEVVNNFNNSSTEYYHLIDPDWVLKVPPAKCNALVNGSTLLSSQVPERLQDCVDMQTCVGYGVDGKCNDYAYCTRERNSWKFSADSCDSQYATCQSFQDSNNKTVSYLFRTLDSGFCKASNAGCTAYSLSQSNGSWQQPAFNATTGKNSGIFMLSTAAKGCSSKSAGCSVFDIASSTSAEKIYLKKAPDYLGCYDSDPASSNSITWPVTSADLNRIQGKPECNSYSKPCIPAEQGCNWYSPNGDSGPRIPGKFKPAEVVGDQVVWNDQCDARCVGYDSYLEQPTNYSAGSNLVYIIPKSGKTCSAAQAGCAGFTNLNPSGGVEYFTYLRPCKKPSEVPGGTGKTFITYEGAKDTGFQLKTFVLVPDVDGSPQYFYKDLNELNGYNSSCSESLYKSGAADPDCRQINDQSGNIYYRLLSKTIVVDDSCSPYRLNNPELYVDNSSNSETACAAVDGSWNDGICQRCYQNGVFKDGTCLYDGLPGGFSSAAGGSTSCSAEVDTCRAYKGNTGNNIQLVINDNFEDASNAWSGASIAPVSTHQGEHSLEFSGNAARQIDLEFGKAYDLTFWSIGSGGTVRVDLVGDDGMVLNVGNFTVGDVWRSYHLGTTVYTGGAATGNLRFSITGGTAFIDNVRLTKMEDNLYLVKKTLSVDPVCDSRPNDNLPGEALGCKAFTNPQNKTFYLTNFSYLCREDAVGCVALFDTKNSNSRDPLVYNVWLTSVAAQKATATVGSDTYSCYVVPGQAGCYVNVFGHTLAEIQSAIPGGMVSSTQYVPPLPTNSAQPIYLVANQASSCSSQEVGCTIAGIKRFSPTGVQFATTTIKNDPSAYASSLCQEQAVGCNAYSSGSGVSYFKDPGVIGQRVCTYRSNVNYRGSNVSGWFWKTALGTCRNSNSTSCTVETESRDCGAANTCVNVSIQPCYPNYMQNGDTYGLWSYGNTANYRGLVGECPAEQNMCTELVDRADNNRSYFVINDSKLTSGDCAGGVSRKAGCALFDQVDNPSKSWNTAASYNLSESRDGQKVPPISTAASNDANVIYKVVKDRDCGQWLQCGSSYSTFDSTKNQYRSVCLALERCEWGSAGQKACGGNVTAGESSVLTEQVYKQRNVGWNGMDYDGYSLFNFYPLESFSQFNLATSTRPNAAADWRLVEKVPCAGNNCSASPVSPASCARNGQACGTANRGICYRNECIANISGVDTEVTGAPQQSCRAYPESDSPFPSTARVGSSPAFANAHTCNDPSNHYACECSYKKVEYGDAKTQYWNYYKPIYDMPEGVCLAGVNDGKACSTDENCKDGTCQHRGNSRAYVGWKGFCLETDQARRINGEESKSQCLTWFPIESLAGAMDIYNQHTEAGSDWRTNNAGRYYCLNSSGSTSTVSFTIGFSAAGIRVLDWQNIGTFPYGGIGNNCNMWDDGYGRSGTAGDEDDCEDMAWDQSYCDNSRKCIYSFGRGHLNVRTGRVGNNQPLDSHSSIDSNTFSSIKKEDIDWIEFKVADAHGYDFMAPGPKFYVFPNEHLDNYRPQSFYQNLNNNASGKKTNAAAGFYRNDPDQILVFTNTQKDTVTLEESGKFFLSVHNGNSWNVEGVGDGETRSGLSGNLFEADSLKAGNSPAGIWDRGLPSWYDYGGGIGFLPMYNQHSGASDGGGPTFSALLLTFDPTTHLFTGIDSAFGNGNYSNGGEDSFGPGPFDVTYEVTFHLRQWCPLIADATIDLSNNDFSQRNRTVVQTNRLWSVPNGTNGPYRVNVSGKYYSYETANISFGSIGNLFDQNKPAVMAQQEWRDPSCVRGSGASGFCTFDEDMPQRDPNVLGGEGYATALPRTGYNSSGVDNLSQLFASVAGSYQYSYSSGEYVSANTLIGSRHVITRNGGRYGQEPIPPEVHPIQIGSCGSGISRGVSGCEESREKGVTISAPTSIEGDKVVITSNNSTFIAATSSFKASMDFYMFANANQMPIRQVVLDWGNGLKQEISGSFRNQRGLISGQQQCTDVDTANDYGHISGQTCDNAYFHADSTYYCKAGLAHYTTNCGANFRTLFPDTEAVPGCCIYQPRVQVKDNWGWCNGNCGRTCAAGTGDACGCYDESWAGRADQCEISRDQEYNHWTPFGGQVIVPAAR